MRNRQKAVISVDFFQLVSAPRGWRSSSASRLGLSPSVRRRGRRIQVPMEAVLPSRSPG